MDTRDDPPIPFRPKAKSDPGQIKNYDNRDDRMQIVNMIGHLPPLRRLEFFRWACSQAVLPGTFGLHPGVGLPTLKLVQEARHCDYANEQLTIDIMQSLTHMWIDYSLDAKKCLDHLLLMIHNRDS